MGIHLPVRLDRDDDRLILDNERREVAEAYYSAEAEAIVSILNMHERLVEWLEASAVAFHDTGNKLGCLTSDNFEDCDTTACVEVKALIAKAKEATS